MAFPAMPPASVVESDAVQSPYKAAPKGKEQVFPVKLFRFLELPEVQHAIHWADDDTTLVIEDEAELLRLSQELTTVVSDSFVRRHVDNVAHQADSLNFNWLSFESFRRQLSPSSPLDLGPSPNAKKRRQYRHQAGITRHSTRGELLALDRRTQESAKKRKRVDDRLGGSEARSKSTHNSQSSPLNGRTKSSPRGAVETPVLKKHKKHGSVSSHIGSDSVRSASGRRSAAKLWPGQGQSTFQLFNVDDEHELKQEGETTTDVKEAKVPRVIKRRRIQELEEQSQTEDSAPESLDSDGMESQISHAFGRPVVHGHFSKSTSRASSGLSQVVLAVQHDMQNQKDEPQAQLQLEPQSAVTPAFAQDLSLRSYLPLVARHRRSSSLPPVLPSRLQALEAEANWSAAEVAGAAAAAAIQMYEVSPLLGYRETFSAVSNPSTNGKHLTIRSKGKPTSAKSVPNVKVKPVRPKRITQPVRNSMRVKLAQDKANTAPVAEVLPSFYTDFVHSHVPPLTNSHGSSSSSSTLPSPSMSHGFSHLMDQTMPIASFNQQSPLPYKKFSMSALSSAAAAAANLQEPVQKVNNALKRNGIANPNGHHNGNGTAQLPASVGQHFRPQAQSSSLLLRSIASQLGIQRQSTSNVRGDEE